MSENEDPAAGDARAIAEAIVDGQLAARLLGGSRRKLRALELKTEEGWRRGRYSGPRVHETKNESQHEREFAAQIETAYRGAAGAPCRAGMTYRLSTVERRDARLEDLGDTVAWETIIANHVGIADTIEARRALRVLAQLPERQREYLSLLVAGFSYREIGELTGGRTLTNVNKHVAKARTRIRREEARGR